MGQYYSQVYNSIDEFEIAMNHSEAEQFKYFISYLKNKPGIIEAMKNKNWAKVAQLYNGSNYQTNNYDKKMADNYQSLKRE
jgi:hypothetical protein